MIKSADQFRGPWSPGHESDSQLNNNESKEILIIWNTERLKLDTDS